MINKASALVYTREKHIGFPGGWFKVQPEDFSDEAVKPVMEYALSAMEDVKPLRSNHKQVRVVIAQNGYVILGMAAYLRDLFSDGWEGIDEKNRPIYGFFGYVWKKEDFSCVCSFPNLTEFASLVAEHIRPNWELSKNARWATQQELVPYRYLPCEKQNKPDAAFVPVPIESAENADRLLEWAIQKAANGQTVSVCTNVTVYDVKDYKTPFQYASQAETSKKSFSAGCEEHNRGFSDSGTAGTLIDNGGPKIHGETITQLPKTRKRVSGVLIALGVVLLILSVALISANRMMGLLWKVMFAASIACLVVGIIRLPKVQKPHTDESVADPKTTSEKNASFSSDHMELLKMEAKTVSQPSAPAGITPQKTVKAKKPEEETTEDLFKF